MLNEHKSEIFEQAITAGFNNCLGYTQQSNKSDLIRDLFFPDTWPQTETGGKRERERTPWGMSHRL